MKSPERSRQYIVVLVNLDTNKPVGFVRSRKQLDIREVLAGEQVLEQITEVSMDMSGNYRFSHRLAT